MDYADILYAIETTTVLHRRSVKRLAKVLKGFKKHGWHDEHLAEEMTAREQALWAALSNLHAQLPGRASA